MVLGLCGGLEIPNGATAPFATLNYNSNDIVSSLGPLNMNPNPSKRTRHVAFIDATPGQQMPDAGNTTAGAPWDAATGGNGKQGPSDSYIPEFMDKFNTYQGGQARPILYLRARVGNPNYVVRSNTTYVVADNSDATVQYNYTHLGPYIQAQDFFGFPGGGTTDATNPNVKPGYNSNVQPYVVASTTKVQIGTGSPLLPASAWDTYLSNPNLGGSPRGVNGYILITPARTASLERKMTSSTRDLLPAPQVCDALRPCGRPAGRRDALRCSAFTLVELPGGDWHHSGAHGAAVAGRHGRA